MAVLRELFFKLYFCVWQAHHQHLITKSSADCPSSSTPTPDFQSTANLFPNNLAWPVQLCQCSLSSWEQKKGKQKCLTKTLDYHESMFGFLSVVLLLVGNKLLIQPMVLCCWFCKYGWSIKAQTLLIVNAKTTTSKAIPIPNSHFLKSEWIKPNFINFPAPAFQLFESSFVFSVWWLKNFGNMCTLSIQPKVICSLFV